MCTQMDCYYSSLLMYQKTIYKIVRSEVLMAETLCSLVSKLSAAYIFILKVRWHQASSWPTVPVPGDTWNMKHLMEWVIYRKNYSTWRKLDPVSLCSLQIPHELIQDWTQITNSEKVTANCLSNDFMWLMLWAVDSMLPSNVSQLPWGYT